MVKYFFVESVPAPNPCIRREGYCHRPWLFRLMLVRELPSYHALSRISPNTKFYCCVLNGFLTMDDVSGLGRKRLALPHTHSKHNGRTADSDNSGKVWNETDRQIGRLHGIRAIPSYTNPGSSVLYKGGGRYDTIERSDEPETFGTKLWWAIL